jgi:hypothetical protein
MFLGDLAFQQEMRIFRKYFNGIVLLILAVHFAYYRLITNENTVNDANEIPKKGLLDHAFNNINSENPSMEGRRRLWRNMARTYLFIKLEFHGSI